ncbi:MAG: glycerophosphodiester phosphodiesterase family protein [Cyanobacteria bacterium P01_D01_bin.73]
MTSPVTNSKGQRCEIIAHRGSSAIAPENTLAAFEQAIADGADRIEMDVQQLADGTLIIFHDETLKRVAGVDEEIGNLNWSEARSFDVGQWFSPRFKGETIPLLTDVLELTAGRIALNLELKTNGYETDLAIQVAQTVQDFGLESACVITSFQKAWIEQLKQTFPDLSLGLISTKSLPSDVLDGLQVVSLLADALTPADLERYWQQSVKTWIWTVDGGAIARQWIQHGVDGIITNQPMQLREELH